MAKYSTECKLKVVQEYLAGHGSYETLSKRYHVPRTPLQRWVKAYKTFGVDGLKPSHTKKIYTFECKRSAVECYLLTGASYQDVATMFGLNNSTLLVRWTKEYRSGGVDALCSKPKGRVPTMPKQRKERLQDMSQDETAQQLKALQDENLRLRIEVAYFKRTQEAASAGKDAEQKARIVHSLRGEFQLKDILAVIEFSKATYMYWQKKFAQPEVPDEREQRILAIRKEHKDYGYRRLWAQLRNLGYRINRKTVQRIVQKLGLQVHSFTHRTRKYSSYRGSVGTVADNLLNRRFKTSIPHQKITTDTSEFKYWLQGEDGKSVAHKLYFDPYMDLFNNEIVSFHIGQTPSAAGIQAVLEEAIRVTSDCPYRRTFHSDQGWAYQMKSYTKRLKEERIFQSMSRKGNCLDNSVMENFFGLLKQEIYYGRVYHSYEELKTAIEEYIVYYNEHCIKKALGWLSPAQYRRKHLAA
ncbi:IS3 family transposase [uncultured Selenomonas sp.]|uniref:IS3 family transposase n=1 Tax=uncultured Selenomonas sp. TaxID=159275 RepID=UPI0037DD6638